MTLRTIKNCGILRLAFIKRSMATVSVPPNPSSIYIPSKKLVNRVAIVTASTEGIGFSIARKLATDGAKVVISSRKEANVQKALDEIKSYKLDVSGLVCHVGKEEDRQRLVDFTMKEHGRIDFLISNAAVNPFMGDIIDTSESEYDKIFDVNVKSAFMLTKKIVPLMRKNDPSEGGSIVFVSSIAGFVPFYGLGVYGVSKTALLGLTKQLALSLGPDNIRVNCLVPGMIKTKFSEALLAGEDDILINTCLKRVGHPDEMGGIVSFLCSKEASYITGENIVAGGGYVTRL